MSITSSAKRKFMSFAKRVVQGYRATSESYVSYLRSIGVEIGDDVVIFSPGSTNIETLNPHLLTIGSHVAMTGPVTILTHDYSVGVTKIWSHGNVLGSQKPVIIGDNVFIGWGATILAGTTIGDNCVIGAGSVVSGHIEGGSIWGGCLESPSAHWKSIMSAAKGSSLAKPSRFMEGSRSVFRRSLQKRCSTSTSISSLRRPMICAMRSGQSLMTMATLTSA